VWFFGWDRWALVFLYWTESGVVGIYAILKMLLAKGVPKKPVKGLGANKAFMILFFLIHYGGFMLVHLGLLTGARFLHQLAFNLQLDTGNMREIMLSGGASMFLSHGFSFIYNYWLGREYERVTVGEAMISPYPRIVLMQLVSFFTLIILAPEVVIVFFKTAFDLIGHLLERRMFKRRLKRAP